MDSCVFKREAALWIPVFLLFFLICNAQREMDMLGQQVLPRCHALVYAACFPSRRGEYPISVLAPHTKPNQLESSKPPCCELRLGWAASFSVSLVGVALRKFLERGLACNVLFIHLL